MGPHWLWLLIALPGTALWLMILLLPWRPWGTRERLEVDSATPSADFCDLTVLIPARNEAETIGRTLVSVRSQDPRLRIVVVDDRSSDGTAEAIHAVGLENLTVVGGRPLPAGWTGKLWALQQGLAEVDTELVLLLDADIELRPGILALMVEHLRANNLDLVSLMASLSMEGFWEKLLMPAFVYFFKLLYPFRLANSSLRLVAAAAGGCILVKTAVLREIGGFESLRGELIDDCALAARVKRTGHRTWIGLSRAVVSHRRYRRLRPIWEMVARTAYTQLHYSPPLLIGCVLALSWAFWLPLVGLAAPDTTARLAAAVALVAAMASYLPVLLYYRRSPAWAVLLPAIGTLYLAMTVDSARRYYRGERSRWRGRTYAVDEQKKASE